MRRSTRRRSGAEVAREAADLVLITLAVASGLPLPLLPVQLLWLNLATNGVQDVVLAFEPAEGDVLLCQRPLGNGPLPLQQWLVQRH